MKALVVYESMFGNTEAAARAVAEGLQTTFEVTVADVRTMPQVVDMDLVIVGGPTHAFGMSRPATRQDAVRQGAVGDAQVGVREWLDRAPRLDGTAAAAFDTKIDKPVPGSAAHRVHRRLRRLGGRMLVSAETFRVTDTAGPLVDGERERARRWGETVGQAAAVGAHRI